VFDTISSDVHVAAANTPSGRICPGCSASFSRSVSRSIR
jgi:hypothetical protein